MTFTGEILLTGDMLHVLSADILHTLLHPVHITCMIEKGGMLRSLMNGVTVSCKYNQNG
jgi:hypothetical protein